MLEPMLNDLRTRRFGYNALDVSAVLHELAGTAAGFCEEVGQVQPAEWGRTVTRQPAEERTLRWLVRQAAHEGRHHLQDIRLSRGCAPSGKAPSRAGPHGARPLRKPRTVAVVLRLARSTQVSRGRA